MIKRAALITLLLALLLVAAPRLATGAANNLAAHALLTEWTTVDPLRGPPR